jgi:hypothetical protein
MAGESGVLGMPAPAGVAVPQGARSSALLLAVAALSTLFFVVAVLYGTWLNYSPVPLSDSWSGIVGFYLDALDDPWAWWRQHYDHRILVSKLFFWLDMRYLGGSNAPLLGLNFLLMLGIGATFQAYARYLLDLREGETRLLLLAGLMLLALSWIQRQNITWEFQNQFYWVYLLPLLACFAMARSVKAGTAWLVLSLALGVASTFSMANGIFALPILAMLALALFRSWRQVLPTGLLAVACIGLFFLGYEHTPGREQGMEFFHEHPLTVVAYTLAYLGNPFYWIAGRIEAAVAGGAMAVALLGWLLCSARLRRSPFALALFAYAAYIIGTAAVTALGRAFYNLELAASSRYTTPALSLWSAVLLLVLARLERPFSLRGRVRVAFLVVLALLGGQQLRAFYFDDPSILFLTPHAKESIALGLQMGVRDQQAMLRLSPFSPPGEVPAIIDRARLAKVSIFADGAVSAAERVGQPAAGLGLTACTVEQLQLAAVEGTPGASTVQGRVPGAAEYGWRHLYFVDGQQRVSGLAAIGRVVFNQLSQERGREFFDGYLLGAATGEVYCQ